MKSVKPQRSRRVRAPVLDNEVDELETERVEEREDVDELGVPML